MLKCSSLIGSESSSNFRRWWRRRKLIRRLRSKLSRSRLLNLLWCQWQRRKVYIPKLRNLHPKECLRTFFFVAMYSDRIKDAQIPHIQLVARLRDILTGRVSKTFQDLSDDKVSFVKVRDNLLASQNRTLESYRQGFFHVASSPYHSFTGYVSCIKSLFNRWL